MSNEGFSLFQHVFYTFVLFPSDDSLSKVYLKEITVSGLKY